MVVAGGDTIGVRDRVAVVDAADIVEGVDVELLLFPVTIILVVEPGVTEVEIIREDVDDRADGDVTADVWL